AGKPSRLPEITYMLKSSIATALREGYLAVRRRRVAVYHPSLALELSDAPSGMLPVGAWPLSLGPTSSNRETLPGMRNHAIAQTRDAEELGVSGVTTRPSTPRARGPVRWWRVTLAASSFFFFGLGGALLGWLVLPLVWLVGGGSLSARRLRCQRTVQYA